MKTSARIIAFLILTAVFGSAPAFAQNNKSEDELYQKIAKLTQSKKEDDREKAYQMSKDFLAQFKDEKDEKVGKIKAFAESYRNNAFNDRLDKAKIAEAFALGKEILAVEPENSYVTMNLAVAGHDARQKNKDDSFAGEAINYAKQTLTLFEAGKLPKTFQPLKDQPEATAYMYYIIGEFTLDADPKAGAQNFYKAASIDSSIKTHSFPYYAIADFYEKEYARRGEELKTKYGAKSIDDPEVKNAIAVLDKLLANMLDAYARAIKYGEAEKNPSLAAWKDRFTAVYTFAKKGDAGMNDYLANQPNTPLPDPTAN